MLATWLRSVRSVMNRRSATAWRSSPSASACRTSSSRGVSFAIFGIYYVGLIGGETLADKGYMPPWLAMWAANLQADGLALAPVSALVQAPTGQ